MVSLRQRKPVSYSTASAYAGIDSDEEDSARDDAQASQEEVPGRGARPSKGSSDSSDSGNYGKTKSRTNTATRNRRQTSGRGRRRTGSAVASRTGRGDDDDASSDEYREEGVGNDDQEEDEDDAIEEDASEGSGAYGEGRVGQTGARGKAKGKAKNPRSKTARAESKLMEIKQEPFNIVDDAHLSQENRLPKSRLRPLPDGLGDQNHQGAIRNYKVPFSKIAGTKPDHIASTYPLHPLGATVLTAAPDLSSRSSIRHNAIDQDSFKTPENLERRRKIWSKHLKHVPLGIPWEFWEGDPWRPEQWPRPDASRWSDADHRSCWVSNESSKLDGPKGALDLSLSECCRRRLANVEVINPERARQDYFPRRIASPEIRVHLGVDVHSEPEKFSLFASRSMGLVDGESSDKNTYRTAQIFDAGGPIVALDWCHMSEPVSERSTGHGSAVQIWSMVPQTGSNIARHRPTATLSCEIVLCFDDDVLDAKWMPFEDDTPYKASSPKSSIGILAVLSKSGAVAIVPVPDPIAYAPKARKGKERFKADPIALKVPPLLRLEADFARGMNLDWACSSRLAVGYSDVTAKRGPDAMDAQDDNPAPTFFIPTHTSAIRQVCFVRIPLVDSSGSSRLEEPPALLCSTGWDGDVRLTDLRNVTNSAAVEKFMRGTPVVGFSGYSDTLWRSDAEYWVNLVRLRPHGQYMEARMTPHEGPITCISGSDYHGMIASGGADGKLKWANGVRGATRIGKQRMPIETVYLLEINRNTGEYRMVDNLAPELANFVSVLNGRTKALRPNSAGWAPRVSVTKVAWNNSNGIGRAGLLASGTASGLARIDWMEGRFYQGIPVSLDDD